MGERITLDSSKNKLPTIFFACVDLLTKVTNKTDISEFS